MTFSNNILALLVTDIVSREKFDCIMPGDLNSDSGELFHAVADNLKVSYSSHS